ncbi:MAG: CDP-alcohol phosphatidyltransferase family protein [Rhodospirillales bacterium]|nr:CDP-alcohol phosphatidyltransferase family protein [Rhodospirillales bacterium]
MNVPNTITIARLVAVPFVVWLILDGNLVTAFWVFLAAAISDALDGIIAKHFHSETIFGAFIDPLADKVLLVGTYITLGHEGFLQTWLVILVVFRDIVIVGGALVFQTVTQSLTMQPLMISKANTVAQLCLAIGVLFIEGYGIQDGPVVAIMGYIVAVMTVWSGATYVITWSGMAAEMEKTDVDQD